MPSAQNDSMEGRIVGERYKITECLRSDASKGTYFCRDLHADSKSFILKTVKPSKTDVRAPGEWGRDLSLLHRLRHPHLAYMSDFGILGKSSVPYFVEEWIEGEDIYSITSEKELHDILDMLDGLYRTVRYLHRRGIVHGGLKPSNVIFKNSDNNVPDFKLCDLGISALRPVWDWGSGELTGMLPYTAPELLLGGRPDPGSDLYSLGVMTYLVLVRQLPFEDADPGFLMQKHLQGSPDLRPVQNLKGGKYISRLLRSLLEKDPVKRSASLDEAIDLLSHDVRETPSFKSGRMDLERALTATRIIGRNGEMMHLQECADRVRDRGRGWTVFLSGDAGSGKTRCMEELKYWGRMEGWRVIESACSPHEEESYSPYKRILAAVQSDRRAEIFHYGQALQSDESVLFDSSMDYAAGQFRDILTRELVHHLSERPTLLLLDDFHEADEATSIVLDYLSSDIQAHPVLMCVGYRPGDGYGSALDRVIALSVRQSRGEMLQIEPLSGESVGELIECMTGESNLKDTLGPWIFRHVGGNPFFLEEMLKHLVEQGALQYREGRWRYNPEVSKQLDIPDSVVTVIRHRLGKLAPGSRDTANWLALINRPVTARFLCTVAPLKFSEITAAFEDLEHRQMIRRIIKESEETVEFRHALIAEVLYSCLHKRKRRNMHGRVAEALEAEPGDKVRLQELARHSMEGKLGGKAVRYALSLASRARMEFSHEVALRCLDYVLKERCGLSREEIYHVVIDAADTMLAMGLPKRAIHRLKKETDGNRNIGRDLKGRMYMQLALCCQHQGNFQDQEAYCRKGLSLFRGLSLSEKNMTRSMLYAELALGAAAQSHPRRGLVSLEKAMRCCPDSGSDALSGRIQSIAAFLQRVACNLHQALLSSREASRILSRTDECYLTCSAYSTLGFILMSLGRLSKALETHRQAVAMSDKSRAVIPRAQAMGNMAECLCRMGRIPQARKALEKAMGAAGESENPAIDHALNTIMAEILLAEHDYAGANGIIRRICGGSVSNRALYAVGHAHYIAANLYFDLGDFDAAIDSIRLLRRMETSDAPCYEHELAEAIHARILFERGGPEEALKRLHVLNDTVTKKRWPYHQALIKLHLGEVYTATGEFETAAHHLRSALRLSRAMQSECLECHSRILSGIVACRRQYRGIRKNSLDAPERERPGSFPGLSEGIEELRNACGMAEASGQKALAWRAHAELHVAFDLLSNQAESLRHAGEAYEGLCRLEEQIPGRMLDTYRNAFERGRFKSDLSRYMETVQTAEREELSSIPAQTGLDQSRILFRVSARMNSIRDPDTLLQEILEQLIQALGMERAQIYLKDESTGAWTPARGMDGGGTTAAVTVSQAILDEVGRRGNPVVSANIMKDPRYSGKDTAVPCTSGRFLCAPLKVSERIIGLLYTDHPKPVKTLNESAINLFAAFCNLSAIAIDNAAAQQRLMREKVELERYLHQVREEYTEIVGKSSAAEALRDRIAIVAASPLDVLITGESGTGKELVAQALYRTCRRSSGELVPVDCGALSDTLAEAELFGYRKGAFTGAGENRRGLLEAADGGILFLDEISNLPYRLQPKLMRVLEAREVRRMGDTVYRKMDIRIIAATNRDLIQEVRAGRFREDLFYRLNKMAIRVPPLRERREDISLLVHCFLGEIAGRESGRIKRFSTRAFELLESYPYPGNIRELINAVSGAYYSTVGTIMDVGSLPAEMRREYVSEMSEDSRAAQMYRDILNGRGTFEEKVKIPFLNHQFGASVVRTVIRMALEDSRGRYRDAFSRLGIPDRSYAVTMQFLKRHRCYLDFRLFRKRRPDGAGRQIHS